ncbi:MAG: glycogen debranching protein GlgX [Gammaproteobacteria bacterium]|nr:glycogen debranching protein GlgX [Gammaproteobacteria bacterium]
MVVSRFRVDAGRGFPPGATVTAEGVNFSIFSRHATAAKLLLFDGDDSLQPMQTIELDPDTNRTFFFWHVFVVGAQPGLQYTWRMDGPCGNAANGFRIDRRRQLLDPWARIVSTTHWDRQAALDDPETGSSFRAVVEADSYDWEGDEPVNHALQDSVIYELHVGGFTRHPSSGVGAAGTFRGLIDKIPYLQSLGVTDVELLPVMAFDSQDVPADTASLGLTNYWGYSPIAFFALHPAYAAGNDVRTEFRDLVKALHRADIGVILDVVFNHTAEGGTDGPVFSFKGLANEVYYHLDHDDRHRYRDYTGCGNTINANHPLVSQMLQQCVDHWAREMHVDGFRFDLASALARGEDGAPLQHAPVLWNIEFSPTLADTHLIAEAWDAAGAHQLGNFPGFRWAEWNGDYRDTVRRFVAGEPGLIGRVASRLAGSGDLFADQGGLPINSINFVTCHDGFTMFDLVSYEHKRNEANGEHNRDGADANWSWNCGVEGPTDDPEINALRRRQVRNCLAILLLSQGVPMMLAGDEMLRTQNGNNNAWCQDNELSWIDWSLVDQNTDAVRFVRELIALRKRHPALRRARFLTGADNGASSLPDVTWYGENRAAPDWENPDGRSLAFTLAGVDADEPTLHVIMNMSDATLQHSLPEPVGTEWRVAVDTAAASPDDVVPPADQQAVEEEYFIVRERSVVVLESA